MKVTSVPEVDTLMRNAWFDSEYMFMLLLNVFTHFLRGAGPSDSEVDSRPFSGVWRSGEVCTVDFFVRHDMVFVMGVAQGECSHQTKMKHGE